ncbi:MAG: hypothetical protein K8S87_11725 [Planctomycetes bacterium]|nr:hypothetical protein [Planctomycetota bacterium]
MNVLYYSTLEPDLLEILRQNLLDGIEIENKLADLAEEIHQNASKFDVVVGVRIPRAFLDNAKNLKYFIIPFVGIPPQDIKNLKELKHLTVINSHFNALYTAEHAWALLLASAKNIVRIHAKLKNNDWTPRYEHDWSIGLAGKTLLLLGYGAIGKVIAKFARTFRLKVIVIKRTAGNDENIDFMGKQEDLLKVLPDADFIISTLPGSKLTEKMLSHAEFIAMKDSVHIVNVGRGPVIDEQALFDGLKSGKVGGAAIDTWWNYPKTTEDRTNTCPTNLDFTQFQNFIYSPHRASHVFGREIERMMDIAEILNAIHAGSPKNIVNIDRGY